MRAQRVVIIMCNSVNGYFFSPSFIFLLSPGGLKTIQNSLFLGRRRNCEAVWRASDSAEAFCLFYRHRSIISIKKLTTVSFSSPKI